MAHLRADVAVIGLGAFGSAALWRLQERGGRVLGLELHDVGHESGSSHGLTRLFRVACLEHPGLPALARRTLDLWRGLARQDGVPLVRQTGCLTLGAPGSRPVRGALAAAEAAGLSVRQLEPAALRREFPQFAGVGRRDVGVWDPEAGLCYPERAVCASVAEARRLGAEVRTRTEVLAVEPDAGGVTLHTSAGEVRAGKAVLATGAGLPALVPELPLVPRPTPLTWFRAADPASDAFTLPRFPAFVWERPDGDHLWGHGSDAQGGHDVKVGVAGLVDDTPFPWQPDDGRLDAAARRLAPRIATAFPGLVPHPVRTDPCVVTDSPDGQFLLGPLPHAPNLLVAGGDTGHGFKHAAGVGELLAQYVHGEEPYCDAGFTDPARFTG